MMMMMMMRYLHEVHKVNTYDNAVSVCLSVCRHVSFSKLYKMNFCGIWHWESGIHFFRKNCIPYQ